MGYESLWIYLLAVALFFLVVAAAALRSELAAAKVAARNAQTFKADRFADLPFYSGWLAGPLAWISVRCKPFVGTSTVIRLEQKLRFAGLEGALEPVTFVSMKVLSFFTGLLLATAFQFFRDVNFNLQAVLIIFLVAVAASFLPDSWLSDTTKLRKLRTLKSLPFFIDLLKISIEAGSNVQGALQYAVAFGPPGPLRNEFAKVLGDIRAGRSRADALHELSHRTNLVAISHMCAAITAAEKQGASLTALLHAQAEQRRQERFSAAETVAMKAPVKMLAPLVMFIFPGTFIILFFPVVMRLIQEGLIG
jgi:tight adherence protein C